MLRVAGTAPASATIVPLHPHAQRAARLAEAHVVAIADRVSAIFFDSQPGENRRLTATVDGTPLGRPLISTSLALRNGGTRHLLLVGLNAERVSGSRVAVALGAEAAAVIDPDWLQSPLVDSSALIDGLAAAGRRRLLKLFLSTGSSLFGLDGASAFGTAAHRLLGLLGVAPVPVASWCPIGSAGRLLTFRVGAGTDAGRIGALVALAAGRIVRLTGSQLRVETDDGGSLLHVHLPRALPVGASLIGLGETPAHLRTPDAAAGPRALVPWLARRLPATQAWVQGIVEAASATDPVAAAQLHELVHSDAPAPRLTVRHLSGTPAGVLHALALDDPAGLVRAIRVERNGVSCDLPLAGGPGGSGSGGSVSGHAPVRGPSRPDDRFRLRLIYHSGRIQTVGEGRLPAYLGEIPAAFDARDAAVAAVVAEARLALDRPVRTPAVAAFGPAPAAPILSVIAAVGPNLDVVRARAAMLFAEPGGREVELVYHVAAGPLAEAARAAVAGAAAVHGIAHRLVVLPADADAAERLLGALGESRGGSVLLMGADVLPAGPGWLAPWLCRLVSARPVLGGTLLDAGGAVADAGGALDEARRLVGLPAGDLPGVPVLPTRRVSAECVGMTRAAAEMLGSAARRYPNPDVMLAETVERLAADGKEAATLLRSRFVRYAEVMPDARAECVDFAALHLVLKRSFSPSGDEDGA